MDKKLPQSSDLDPYAQGLPAYSSSSEPSAPSLPSVQQQEYQSIPIPPTTNHYRYSIRRRDSNGRHFPINAALFLLGLFVFPPVWLISIFWKSDNKYEQAWRKVNIVSSIILTSLLVLTGIFYYMFAETIRDGNKDPSWEIPNQIINFYSNYGVF